MPFRVGAFDVLVVVRCSRSGASRVRRVWCGLSCSAAVGDKDQAVTVRIDEDPRSGSRPIRVECGIVGRNLAMSAGAETIGEIDDVVTVREIQDKDVLDRRSGRQRLLWRDELELGAFVWHTEDSAVEPIVVLEGPQDAEPNDPLVEVA